MTLKPLFQNQSHSVGIVRATPEDTAKMKKLAGFWNIELVKESIDLFKMIGYRDVEISVITDGDSAMLLVRSPRVEDNDLYVAICGKTGAIV